MWRSPSPELWHRLKNTREKIKRRRKKQKTMRCNSYNRSISPLLPRCTIISHCRRASNSPGELVVLGSFELPLLLRPVSPFSPSKWHSYFLLLPFIPGENLIPTNRVGIFLSLVTQILVQSVTDAESVESNPSSSFLSFCPNFCRRES